MAKSRHPRDEGLEQGDLLGVYEGVLTQMGLGVVVCDEELCICEASDTARSILNRFDSRDPRSAQEQLPEPLRRCMRTMLEDDSHHAHKQTQRVEPVPGLTLYATLLARNATSNGAHVLVLREGQVREQALLNLLQERFDISYRERQLVSLVREGLTNRDIADKLGLSEGTIKNYLHHMYQKLGIRSRSALAPLLERLRSDQAT